MLCLRKTKVGFSTVPGSVVRAESDPFFGSISMVGSNDCRELWRKRGCGRFLVSSLLHSMGNVTFLAGWHVGRDDGKLGTCHEIFRNHRFFPSAFPSIKILSTRIRFKAPKKLSPYSGLHPFWRISSQGHQLYQSAKAGWCCLGFLQSRSSSQTLGSDRIPSKKLRCRAFLTL